MKNKMKFIAVLGMLTIFLSFAFKPFNNKRTIVIDAGHGGKDFGAQIGKELEKKIVENIANKISLLNGNGEIEIVLLRNSDSFLELEQRVNRINEINPSLVISLHTNSSKNLEEKGIHAYVSQKNEFYEQSKISAKKLLESVANQSLLKGEVKDANFYIVRKSKCPAVLLEIGYLSNEKDKTYITSENGQNEIAAKIFECIKK